MSLSLESARVRPEDNLHAFALLILGKRRSSCQREIVALELLPKKTPRIESRLATRRRQIETLTESIRILHADKSARCNRARMRAVRA